MSAYILSNCLEHQLIDDHYTRADWLAEGQPNLRVLIIINAFVLVLLKSETFSSHHENKGQKKKNHLQ